MDNKRAEENFLLKSLQNYFYENSAIIYRTIY